MIAQLWKETCDNRLENKELKRDWTRYPDEKYSVTDNLVKTVDPIEFMTVKLKDGVQVVELDSEYLEGTDTQKWTKSEKDEDGFFTLTNPQYGKLLTANKRKRLTLEGML